MLGELGLFYMWLLLSKYQVVVAISLTHRRWLCIGDDKSFTCHLVWATTLLYCIRFGRRSISGAVERVVSDHSWRLIVGSASTSVVQTLHLSRQPWIGGWFCSLSYDEMGYDFMWEGDVNTRHPRECPLIAWFGAFRMYGPVQKNRWQSLVGTSKGARTFGDELVIRTRVFLMVGNLGVKLVNW